MLTTCQATHRSRRRWRESAASHQDAGAFGHHPAQLRGAQVPGAQWEDISRRGSDGGDGGSQAGRVLSVRTSAIVYLSGQHTMLMEVNAGRGNGSGISLIRGLIRVDDGGGGEDRGRCGGLLLKICMVRALHGIWSSGW